MSDAVLRPSRPKRQCFNRNKAQTDRDLEELLAISDSRLSSGSEFEFSEEDNTEYAPLQTGIVLLLHS